MALTRNFRKTIMTRAQNDPAFRENLLEEAVECLLSNDVETGRALLRDYINATMRTIFSEFCGTPSQAWYQQLLCEIAEEVLPPRRNRINPRVIKRKMSKWPKKRPIHRYYPQPTQPFEQAIVMCH